jgi:RNA recognition motif-containing protein
MDAGAKYMSTKLYVGNLSYETTETDLQTLFEKAGQVASVNVIRDRATGQPRGFAFVEMSSPAEANTAITQLDQQPFGGRNLTVNHAKPMTSRSGGGDYGGRTRRSEPRW